MAVQALHSAATGLSALSTALDVTANNLANANTVGFKSARVNFDDLLYQEKRQPGVENANGDERPAGLYVGLGVKVANTQFNFSEVGAPQATGQPLDFYIEGDGFFQVDILEEEGGGTGYTRAGTFFRNSEGDIVLGNSDGPRLEPNINIPLEIKNIEVSKDGTVYGFDGQNAEPQNLGQIELSNFVNPPGLKPIGGNIWIETPASGPPINGVPGEGNFGTLLQGHLESSNVDPVTELVSLIKTQRAFEMNSQTIQAADQTLSVISNLRRG